MHWDCGVPGKPNTDWVGGLYKVHMDFSDDYPSKVRRPISRRPPPPRALRPATTRRRSVAAQVQVRAAFVPSERLPFRNHLPVDPERGGGLAARHHHQADAPRCVLSVAPRATSFAPSTRGRVAGIQDLLDTPNPNSPAQSDAYQLFIQDKAEYKRRVRQEAAKNRDDA